MSGDELPKTNAEIVALAKYVKDGPHRAEPDNHQIFVSYLLTHGFGRLRVRNLLREVWPEASKCIELSGEELYRATMLLLPLSTRLDAIRYLDADLAKTELRAEESQALLEEWDALHFPNQLPAPIRERALRRHRFAIGESDEP